jgi:hypothetical protein
MKAIDSLTFLIMPILILVIYSCNSLEDKTKSEMELELHKKELQLKERELSLEEKKLEQQSLNSTKVEQIQSEQPEKKESFYVINVAATKSEMEAKKLVNGLLNNGYNADYLWIPDYASLSGALFYSVYIGPYSTQYDCEVATEDYRKDHPEAYGLLVSQDKKRVQITGIGKVNISSIK